MRVMFLCDWVCRLQHTNITYNCNRLNSDGLMRTRNMVMVSCFIAMAAFMCLGNAGERWCAFSSHL